MTKLTRDDVEDLCRVPRKGRVRLKDYDPAWVPGGQFKELETDELKERAEDFLGSVGDGRERVGREDREPGGLGVALVMRQVRGNRFAHKQVLEGTDGESWRHDRSSLPPSRREAGPDRGTF